MNRARATLTLFLVVPAAFAWACGGTDGADIDGGVDSGGNDGTVANDSGPGKDGSSSDGATGDAGTSDTGTTDTGATDTGTNDTGTTGDGGLPTGFDCTKPSDCDAGFCCGTIVFNGGQIPNCTLEDASSTCASTCKSNVLLSCNAKDTVRACVAHSDCADAGIGYTDCCTVPFGNNTVEFCWTKNYQQFITGMTCL